MFPGSGWHPILPFVAALKKEVQWKEAIELITAQIVGGFCCGLLCVLGVKYGQLSFFNRCETYERSVSSMVGTAQPQWEGVRIT